MATLEDLLELETHAVCNVRGIDVMAVPGGWLYMFQGTTTFVPRPIDTVDKQQVK